MRIAFVLVLLALSTIGPRAAEPERTSVYTQAEQAMWWGDFEGLERLYADVLAKKQRTPWGDTMLGQFRSGMLNAIKGGSDVPDAFHRQIENLTAAWTKAHPGSALAHFAHANALLNRAWAFRGHGYSQSVLPHAWADFEEHIGRGIDHIVARQQVALTDSGVHKTLIALGRARNWSADRAWAIAQEGLKVNADDDGLYYEALESTLPRWGGSAVAVDRFVQLAVAHAGPDRGPELYAGLYLSAASGGFGHRLFEDSGAQWHRIKEGMDALVKKYPSPRGFNQFAYLACLAKDKPVFLDMLERVGDKPELARWGANPQRTFETCRRWGREQ